MEQAPLIFSRTIKLVGMAKCKALTASAVKVLMIPLISGGAKKRPELSVTIMAHILYTENFCGFVK